MTSARALALTEEIIKNDLDTAEPLLKLLHAVTQASDDGMTRDVMLFLYSKTNDCQKSMVRFISESRSLAA